jgi:pimeloyl-ACP methyl ester carboxylesterase
VILFAWTACATLDAFVFNPVHCSTVGPETCADADSEWDAICARCADAYDWERDYPWFPETLPQGATVRPIDPAFVTEASFETADGLATLDAYFVASHRDDPDAATVTVVYSHGNYAGIEHYLPRVRYLHEAGYNVFVWDYRGYGKSEPATTPTGEQHLADADAAWAVATELAPNADQVVSYGYSLGAVAATRMAEQGDPCALVLEAPFTTLGAIAQQNTTLSLGEQMLSSGAFDNAARMEVVDAPTLAMTGTADDLFPPDEVRDLVERGPGPREVWTLQGVHHGISDIGIPEAGYADYAQRLGDFLALAGCRSSAP